MMSTQRTQLLIDAHRLKIRRTLWSALLPLAFLRGVLDGAIASSASLWVDLALMSLFWLAYVGVVYYATRGST